MSGHLNRCSHCRAQPTTKTVAACPLCHTAAAHRLLPPPHHLVFHRWAKKWMKALAGPSFYRFDSSAGSMVALPAYPPVRGDKRAVLIGVAYRSTRNELRGTITDVNCMKFLLQTKFGFPEQSILMLSDDESDRLRIPTRQNMVAALRWLVQGCRPGDSLFFHFSGHGSQRVDFSKDEVDGFDETLCPVDYEVNGMISDDEVNETIVRPLPPGVKLHAVIDSCHSGSSLDLPYVCKTSRNGDISWEVRTNVKKTTNGGLAICFSGCDDNQTSSDTSVFTQDIVTGAMTYCFIQAVESGHRMTYGGILLEMRAAIRGSCGRGSIGSLLRKVFRTGLTQVPQLSSSEPFDIFGRPFIL